jgi:hypothetical protein
VDDSDDVDDVSTTGGRANSFDGGGGCAIVGQKKQRQV